MVRYLSLFVLTLLTTNVLLADDAYLLPERVFRVWNVYSNTEITSQYDDKGRSQSTLHELNDYANQQAPGSNAKADPKTTINRYTLAVEYGMTDTFGMQVMVPVYLKSTTNPNANDSMKQIGGASPASSFLNNGKNSSTLGDILVGGKWQIYNSGSSKLAADSNTWRVALAGGFYAPTGKLARPNTLDIPTTYNTRSKSFIFGVRTFIDYQVNPWFFVNLFSEHHVSLEGDSMQLNKKNFQVENGRYQEGTHHMVEMDFNFRPSVNATTNLDFGTTFKADYLNKGRYSKFSDSSLNKKTDSASLYTFNPYIGFFTKSTPVPSTFYITYSSPLDGRNNMKAQTLAFQWRSFLKI